MEITLQYLKENFDVNNIREAISLVETNLLTPLPAKPSKPKSLNKSYNSYEVYEYAKKLQEYEALIPQWEKEIEEHLKQKKVRQELILDFLSHLSGVDDIPEQYRQKVRNKAWDEGHSHGYYEVYHAMESLVELFK